MVMRAGHRRRVTMFPCCEIGIGIGSRRRIVETRSGRQLLAVIFGFISFPFDVVRHVMLMI